MTQADLLTMLQPSRTRNQYSTDWFLNDHTFYAVCKRRGTMTLGALATLHLMLARRGVHDLASRVYATMVNEVLRRSDDAG